MLVNRCMITFNKVDKFCKNFDKNNKNFISGKPFRRRPTMPYSEVMSILLLFQISGFKCFKYYYIFYVQWHLRDDFLKTVYYNQFIALSRSVILPLTIFLKACFSGSCMGILFRLHTDRGL